MVFSAIAFNLESAAEAENPMEVWNEGQNFTRLPKGQLNAEVNGFNYGVSSVV